MSTLPRISFIMAAALMLAAPAAQAQTKSDAKVVTVPASRSALVVMPSPMAEVMVADPEIADVHAHNATHLTVVGKKLGRTNVRVFDKGGNLLREFEVSVSYDLPAIRRSLRNFLPDEVIGVEMVNTSIALTGQISSAAVADKAVKIVKDFIQTDTKTVDPANPSGETPEILNLMQITSGQQVMLRVRVGEINRTALKTLGIDLNMVSQASGTGLFTLGTGTGIAGLATPEDSVLPNTPGIFGLTENVLAKTHGVVSGRWQPNGPTGNTVSGLLKALERDGLFKLLAEPNLVAVSGEEAEFLAGGEIPVPVPQAAGNTAAVTIEYKPFGVAVKFRPFVLSENRLRMEVQPEVSELDDANAAVINTFRVPALTTRRAKTTVELAPGESFMIAGLIRDQTRANIDQLPGVKELPVLGALFRSTEFQRSETELVIAVTPYLVDPMKSSDVKLPTDDFRPSSQMEMFFYGALGSLSGNVRTLSQTPPVEGPIGFMVD